MPNASEVEIIQKLKERVARANIADVKVTYRVSGGMPGEAFSHEELDLFSRKLAKARIHAHDIAAREVSREISEAEMRELLQGISESVADLIPRSEAHFLPDSLIGSITIQVDDKEASFFFLADEEEQKQQDRPVPIKAARMIEKLSLLSRRLLQ